MTVILYFIYPLRKGTTHLYSTKTLHREALKPYQDALQIYRQLEQSPLRNFYPIRSKLANTLHKLGEVYDALGQRTQALSAFQEAIPLYEALGRSPNATAEERKAFGELLYHVGTIYQALSQYPQAEKLLKQAAQVAEQAGDLQTAGASLGALSLVYIPLGQAELAKTTWEQSIALRDQSVRQLDTQLNQSPVKLSITQILASSKKFPAIAAIEFVAAGDQYEKAGQYAQALESFQQALALEQQTGDRSAELRVLFRIAFLYDQQGQYPQAVETYQKAVMIAREVGDRQAEAIMLYSLGVTLEKWQQPELAIGIYKQAINIHEVIRQEIRVLPREEQQGYVEFTSATYRELANLLLQQGRVMEALEVLDLLKVQELQDFFKDVKGNQRTAQGVELLNEEQQILRPLATTPPIELKNYFTSPGVAALIQQLRKTAQEQNLKLPTYVDLQTRLQKLGTNSALLYPLILSDRIELVLFTRHAPPIHRAVKVKQAELEQAVKAFREAIQRPASKDIRQPAQQLYTWLIKPVEADLQQAKINTLIYAPDGQMRYVPLAALYDGQHWLVENYQINYITALSLTKLEPSSSQQPKILAGAFTDQTGIVDIQGRKFPFNAIPFAVSEVDSLAKRFPNTTKLLGKDFNRAAMTSDRLNTYGIVHLATHGQLVSGAPEDSFILLNNNEYITLRDIKDWQLPNVALVVLSACQTALGEKLGSGIEIIGFGYQLQQAQARASIATLWEINDTSTSDLMDGFYTRMQGNQLSPVEALREAQIAMITGKTQGGAAEEGRSSVIYNPGQNQTAIISRDRSHPYYWAPFILIGNGL